VLSDFQTQQKLMNAYIREIRYRVLFDGTFDNNCNNFQWLPL